jgi:hypothetical protein
MSLKGYRDSFWGNMSQMQKNIGTQFSLLPTLSKYAMCLSVYVENI